MDEISLDLLSAGLMGLCSVVLLLGVMNDNGLIAASGLGLIGLNVYLQLERK